MTVCFIGLGSNLGDSCDRLRQVLDDLAALPGSRLLACSSLYRSAPVGYLDQPDFVNAVAKIQTELEPQELLAGLLNIERQHGRERLFENAPRTLDLDLLLYGDSIVREPGLTVPHPEMHKRAFVLLPLLEIDIECVIPVVGRAEDAMQDCLDQAVERLIN